MGCAFSSPYDDLPPSYQRQTYQTPLPDKNARRAFWGPAEQGGQQAAKTGPGPGGQPYRGNLVNGHANGGSPQPAARPQQKYVPRPAPAFPPQTPVQQTPVRPGTKPMVRTANVPSLYTGQQADAGASQPTAPVPHHHAPEEDESSDTDGDWDQYGYDEDERRSSGQLSNEMSDGPVSSRQRESSLFGLTEKRARAPLRETKSLKLAKLRGCTFVNQYVVIKYLGRGACGRVFLCMDMTDNRLYAVKIVKKMDLEASRGANRPGQRRKRNPIEDLRREVAIMRTLRHKNIVSLQEVVDDPSGNKMLLVMDYMEGGPVMTREALERGRCIPETLALQYFRDMCKALDYLHFNKVVHGDLKPENVLMSARGSVTLSDFGCSKVIISGNEYLERCNGTPAFLAPEMMRPHSRYRGRPTDVYALGACLYTFVFGRIPFNAPNVFKLFQVVQNEPLRFPDHPVVSPQLQDLLQKMLHKEPKQRITMSKVMRHPWTTKRGAWPCKSLREMLKAGESLNLEEPELPDLMSTINVLDVPRQDHLQEVLRPGLPERTYKDGDILLRQGDQGNHLMYILSGQVEVLIKLPPIRESSRSRHSNSGMRSTVTTGGEPEPPKGDANPLHTTTASGNGKPAQQELVGDDLPPALLEGASKAREFTSVLQRGMREYLVAVRSEGQFLGEMASFATAAVRCATVRAKGPVRVRLIPGEYLHDCVQRIPEARQQAKEMLWMRQSENMILEAMTRLSAVHDALEEMLGGGPAVPNGNAAPA